MGAAGRLGTDVGRAHAAAGEPFDLVRLGRRQLDLARPDVVPDGLAKASFDVLINCAAYHDTDQAEDDAALAFAVNGHAVQRLAQLCERKAARFIHVSTDYVFGGDAARRCPLTEGDPTAPVNVYGASKALGETLARLALEDLVVLRVASLFGVPGTNANRGNFVETIIGAGRQKGELRVVDDQIMSPTFTADAAATILKVLKGGCSPGTYHLVNTGATSWFGLAKAIVQRSGIAAVVTPCRSDATGRKAARPAFSALDNAKVREELGAMPSWQDALGRYLRAGGFVKNGPPTVAGGECGAGSARTGQHPVPRPFLFGGSPSRDTAFVATEALYPRTRNLGNLAFRHAIDLHLGPRLPVVGWTEPEDRVNAAGDVGVVPAANQLGRHGDFGRLAQRFEAVDVPLVMIGLGAQSDVRFTIPQVPPSTITWLHRVVERAPSAKPNLAVRGEFTRDVLHRYGLADHAEVVGCPSLFINPSQTLGLDIAARVGRQRQRIAVVAGHQRWRHLSAIEQSLGRLVSRTNGSYIGQDPLEMVMLTRGEARRLSTRSLQACRDHVCPDMELEDFVRWSERHGQAFFDAAVWMEHYRRFDFVVGTRIHGVMLALQAGVPALCIAHDSRTLELCETMKVPHVLARDHPQGLVEDQLWPLFHFDGAEFDANRRRLGARYVTFLEGNGLQVADWVRLMAEPPRMEQPSAKGGAGRKR